MIVITGATGQLGRLVIAELLKTIPAAEIVAAVRDPAKADDLKASGVQVRLADYNQPATLVAAFKGADKLLLISSNEIGQRITQHRAVIEAAQRAEVKLVAYTSVLHADTSLLALAVEHKATEEALKASGLPYVLLRNGWYTENYAAGAAPALARGEVLGSSGAGRISTAARVDYAAAAASVLLRDDQASHIYELAGDEAFDMTTFAAEIARIGGKPVVYRNLPEAEYRSALLEIGLPQELAEVVSDASAAAAKGELFDDSRALSRLIGRPTTGLSATLEAALASGHQAFTLN